MSFFIIAVNYSTSKTTLVRKHSGLFLSYISKKELWNYQLKVEIIRLRTIRIARFQVLLLVPHSVHFILWCCAYVYYVSCRKKFQRTNKQSLAGWKQNRRPSSIVSLLFSSLYIQVFDVFAIYLYYMSCFDEYSTETLGFLVFLLFSVVFCCA